MNTLRKEHKKGVQLSYKPEIIAINHKHQLSPTTRGWPCKSFFPLAGI